MRLRLMTILILVSSGLVGCGGTTEGTVEMKPTDVSGFEGMKKNMIANLKKNSRGIKLPPVAREPKNEKSK